MLSLFVSGCNDGFKETCMLGRKICLFVHYMKQVDGKQWMAKDVASIQWRGGVGQCMTI